jgi:CRISPR-associated protein (TIGR02584 family)
MPQTILLAVVGQSPAVLTETLWALAKDGKSPIIPDKVIVLTTTVGAQTVKEQLFGKDELWVKLRRDLLGKGHAKDPRLDFGETPDRLRVFTQRQNGTRRELARMDTKEETEAVGDCMVEELWKWVNQPDTELLASLSGGFKTMSAMFYAAMTLLARKNDRILHVLVNPPYDGGTKPLFYWPSQPQQDLQDRAGKPVSAADAKIVLTDVEFPPLRRLFGDYDLKEAPSFKDLVHRCRLEITERSGLQKICVDGSTQTVEVDGETMTLNPVPFCLLSYLLRQKGQRFGSMAELGEAYAKELAEKDLRNELLNELLKNHCAALGQGGNFDMGRFSRSLNELRTVLKKGGSSFKRLASLLPIKNQLSLVFDGAKVEFIR